MLSSTPSHRARTRCPSANPTSSKEANPPGLPPNGILTSLPNDKPLSQSWSSTMETPCDRASLREHIGQWCNAGADSTALHRDNFLRPSTIHLAVVGSTDRDMLYELTVHSILERR